MCALTPFPTPNWPVNSIGYQHNYIYESSGCLECFFQSPPPQEEIPLDSQSPPSFTQTSNFDPCMVKKLNHNASERDRRKKVNKQVERLVLKREELMLRVSKQGGGKRRDQEKQQMKSMPKGRCLSGSVAVSMNRVSDSEVSVQISGREVDNRSQLSVSEMLHYLEQQGFLLLNASSFESFGGFVFYNIHLQMESKTVCKVGSEEALSEKILALCDNREHLGL
ncbi:Pentatricopeptide repeat-containing protein [Hibiscus syriacus]|uniref:Pentatricopeptide repeat-containing protein n=1 Tax=Hibiscus syriacus TaxID=106335 RepID=A0A6A3D686_HIBSY|nr:Pentatricopeptide repeat-containing protein [Hibiscus syriacus]